MNPSHPNPTTGFEGSTARSKRRELILEFPSISQKSRFDERLRLA
jgi:hypothetical protein